MHNVTANGASIPALGFGTFRMSGPDVLRMVPQVLKLGYRHIDTAQIYGNEAEVGEGIANSGVKRGDVFLTTKVWVSNYKRADFLRSVDESLGKLRTDYVDLLLLHWPNEAVPLAEQIGALNEVQKAGKVRHIGVSNFNRALLTESVRLSDAPIVTNQIEIHPYIDQSVMLEAARKAGQSVTAYYAMADGKVFADPVLKDIGARHGKSVAQVVLRWLVQQEGVIALSKTVGEQRAAENLAIFDFELTAEEMAAIHGLARPDGRIVSPDGLAPVWD
ncbi:aldo/keto reductase [Azospirillum rugosum]|uniref:Diketogulonate reductase-like aldo/keto reductase n=1 Tax=Azospirillum rugosum TaxID=416170 RepID=A0ABS4SPS6_9PROT|nr:aldo/keto reductase [Azospirillum rugosum]MBP2294549.1 diketogulonate reductase-like aldo/keto reductase [Azospirillum rugosum]MDQ0524663.1 diketogulonate reductase-like aldo/keto reductase [Azospirillum rugosum]